MDLTQQIPRIAFLFAAMAALALVEAWIPFRARALRRERLRPNLALTLLFVAVNLLLTIALLALVAQRHPQANAPWQVFAGIVVLDFSAYLVHVLMHKVPALWRLHRVHHSDREVDVTTAYRQHPLETVLRFAFTAAPAAALGLSPEAVALYRLLSGANALLEHANVYVAPRFERTLCLLVVTPLMHKVHHSRAPAQTDSNYANIFSGFDRLFGTWRPSAEASGVRYGLDEFDAADLSAGELLALPWRARVPAEQATTEVRSSTPSAS